MNLSIGYITARKEPKFEWFLDSLAPQIRPDDNIQIVMVDLNHDGDAFVVQMLLGKHPVTITQPKPTVWQGKSRRAQRDYWAASNSRNTALCLAKHEFIAFCDDRCVLSAEWLQSVRNAREQGYAVFGSYEKRHNMVFEKGIIKDAGTLDGTDPRSPGGKDHRSLLAAGVVPAPGQWAYGCTLALFTEWALMANGYSEMFDGMGYEDTHFGCMLKNNNFPLKYCPAMKVIQDRTPNQSEHKMERTSKQRYPHDKEAKDFKALAFYNQKRSEHYWDIRAIREQMLNGGTWPEANWPMHDWFDGQAISDFK